MRLERGKTCSFTGHRPEKLPWRSNEADARCLAAKAQIAHALDELYAQGYRHFICGMARGGDFYFGEAVLALRAKHPDVTLEAAIPCIGQEARWSAAEQERYTRLRHACDFETLVSKTPSRASMQRRNQYMVSQSSAIIALYNGGSGGTQNTMLLSLREGLQQRIIDPDAL